jgi:hypothetical protein
MQRRGFPLRSLWMYRLRKSMVRGPGCRNCGRHDIAEGALFCGRCRKEFAATPLDKVLYAIGWTAKEFAEATGLPLRTIVRAAKGERVSVRVARRLAKITKLPFETFRPPLDESLGAGETRRGSSADGSLEEFHA